MVTVLVAEDDRDNRELLVSILTHYGFQTLTATNGHQAIQTALESRPDLIMMDISMPIINGLEAIRTIKADPAMAAVPIIAMSAYDGREDMLAAREAGCVDFLPKPMELIKLKGRIDQILAEHGAAPE